MITGWTRMETSVWVCLKIGDPQFQWILIIVSIRIAIWRVVTPIGVYRNGRLYIFCLMDLCTQQ